MYSIVFYVPDSHLQVVKEALFEAGAGKIGNYSHCAWQTKGQGQFRPLNGSHPFQGKHDQLETVKEYRVEMVCEKHCIKQAVAALKTAHPYEAPAYQVILLENS
jgi:structural hemagglutinin/hemolysin toxin protein RtxA